MISKWQEQESEEREAECDRERAIVEKKSESYERSYAPVGMAIETRGRDRAF